MNVTDSETRDSTDSRTGRGATRHEADDDA